MTSPRTAVPFAGPAPGSERVPVARYLAITAATTSLGAAAIHFAVAEPHWEEWWAYGAFFIACSWLQVAFAAVALVGRPRWMLALGSLGQLAVVGLWAYTRTKGLWFGPEAGEKEEVGVPDTVSVGLEIAAGLVGLALAVRSVAAKRVSRDLSAGITALAMTATVGLTSISLLPRYAEHHDEMDEGAAVASLHIPRPG